MADEDVNNTEDTGSYTTQDSNDSEIEAQEIAEEEEEEAIEEEESEAEYQAGITRLAEEGMSHGGPSFFKYFIILIPWAIVVDIVDLADMTGVGAIVAKVFSFLSWASMLFILWFTDSNIKRAQSYGEDLEKNIIQLQENIAQNTRRALRVSKTLRKVPGMKGVSRAIPRGLVKVRRIMRKNPITKVLIGGAINLIPLLAVLNLFSVWIFLGYLDERKTYRQIRETAEDLLKNEA